MCRGLLQKMQAAVHHAFAQLCNSIMNHRLHLLQQPSAHAAA
jgi:hypothetical protein